MNELFHRLKIRMLLVTKPVAFFKSLNQLDWYQQTLQNWVRKNNFPTSSKILEVGCATGTLSRYISNLKHDLTGVDLSESMITVAQKNNPRIRFHVADVNKLPFETESFDSVISASLLNIVTDREKALTEMIRVCKSGGTISILVPLMGFNDTKLNTLKSSLQVTGFSLEALRAWHKLAPKMTVLEVNDLFRKFGLETQKPKKYLNGMVFSITAIKVSLF
jgi:ubiquinone/menaquinone biosynthesis C-methylase UbiE